MDVKLMMMMMMNDFSVNYRSGEIIPIEGRVF